MNVLRDAMAVDSLDQCGVYFGTTGGQVYASADAGDTGTPIVRDLPAVLSVEVQTLHNPETQSTEIRNQVRITNRKRAGVSDFDHSSFGLSDLTRISSFDHDSASCSRSSAELARVDGEVQLEVEGPVTQRSVLDALEARYPVLRGTIRDHVTQKRRAFVRFFACEQDLSHELPDTPLPDAVAAG